MENNEKTYYPETIQDNPFPQEEGGIDTGSQSQSTTETYTPKETPDNALPRKVIARETISSALNTKSRKILAEFQFTELGAIQIGKYENGVSGDMRISPNGIVARNKDGTITLSVDGDTGDAVFKGQIQAGSILTGLIYLGDETGNIVIDGANQRIVVNDGSNDRILIGFGKGLF